MLWNKKEEKSLLPDLPSLETPFKQDLSQISEAEDPNEESDPTETHALPSFPDSANLKGFSQTVIKGAVSDEDKETINRLIQKIQKNDISSESLWLTEAVTLDDLAIEQFQNIIDFINALLVNDNNGPDLCGLSDMANAYFMYIFEYKKLQMSNNKVMPHARDNLDISLFLCQRRFSEFIVSQAKKLMGGINNVNRTEEG